jgi:hypothetical protein
MVKPITICPVVLIEFIAFLDRVLDLQTASSCTSL